MRIAIFLNEFPALSESFILNRIIGLIDRGHNVQVIAQKPRYEAFPPPEYRKYRLYDKCVYLNIASPNKHSSKLKLEGQRALFNLYKKGLLSHKKFGLRYLGRLFPQNLAAKLNADFDVLYVPFGDNAIRAMQLQDKGLLRGPLVVSFHGYDLSSALSCAVSDLYPKLFERTIFALPVCQYYSDRLISLGLNAYKSIVLYSGVSTKFFKFRGVQKFDDPIQLISAGRFVEKKGFKYIIEAAKQLEEGGQRIHLHLVGNGPKKDQLLDEAKKILSPRSWTFHGWLSPKKFLDILRKSDVYIGAYVKAQNGDEDSIPNVMKEAMSVGLPVIATNRSGTPELIEHGRSGLLIEPNNASQITRAVLQLQHDPINTSRMIMAARRTVETRFDTEIINNRFEEILQEASTVGSTHEAKGDYSHSSKRAI